jgi:hypothetical protein
MPKLYPTISIRTINSGSTEGRHRAAGEVWDFVINMKTAKALGIEIPQSILVQATQVIG